MQQLIKSARRATPRTLIASQQKKWTLRKPLISRCGWIEEKKKDRARSNCHPSCRRNSELSSSISGDVNKMKARHDSLELSNGSVLQFSSVMQLSRKAAVWNSAPLTCRQTDQHFSPWPDDSISPTNHRNSRLLAHRRSKCTDVRRENCLA